MMYVLYAYTHEYDEMQVNMHNERETKKWIRKLEKLRRKVSEKCAGDGSTTDECVQAKLELSKMEDDHIF